MEKELKFKTKDGKLIHGILSYARPNSKSVLVLVHGLTGFSEEAKNLAFAREALRKGMATFRFDLYSWKPGARLLHQCDVTTHARDLDLVIKNLRRRGFKNVVVAGHSMGGPTMLLANPKLIDGLIMLDCPGDRYFRENKLGKYMKRYDSVVLDWGTRMLAGKKLNKQLRKGLRLYERIAEFKCPIHFLVAGKGVSQKDNDEMKSAAINSAKTRLVTVPNATHNFNEEGAFETMVRETIGWFRYCCK